MWGIKSLSPDLRIVLIKGSHLAVYQVKKRYPDGRGAARVNMEGDLNVSFPKSLTSASSTPPSSPRSASRRTLSDEECDQELNKGTSDFDVVDGHDGHAHGDDEEYDEQDISGIHVAWKFLLAGGIAGLGELNPDFPGHASYFLC